MSFSQRPLEWWISVVRLLLVALAILQVLLASGYPPGYERVAWLLVAALAVGAVVLYQELRYESTYAYQVVAMTFDFLIIAAFALLFTFESGTPSRQLLFLAIVAGAARFGMAGGIAVAVAAVPVAAYFEDRRSHFFHVHYRLESVTFQAGAGLLMALVVGWLYARLDEQRSMAEQRADEAEALRDALGRRADLLEAANRCSRALSSSLDLDEAFSAFIRELRGLIPFDRMAIVLAENGRGRVIATAGELADEVMPPGSQFDLERHLLGELVARGQTVYRRELDAAEYAEEAQLIELGLRSRVAAPLLVGARTIGLVSIGRSTPDGFREAEIELVSLLGRLVASAVQNIRAYDSERRTVDELRRLSDLRADFVSLVSHEMRSPMAAVIGAARTLQLRWDELRPDQRDAFLALIGDETARLASLIGDVLDTSRIEAGTFSYRFGDVDLVALVEDSVTTASVGQDDIPVVTEIGPTVPKVRGDADRLRQVLSNMIDNAVKYSPAGEDVQVRIAAMNGGVVISVSDRGPGIEQGDQRLIFEKFGRIAGPDSKPGTGLGLYIARSIAEAHGGTLEVSSALGRGAVFTLTLPV